MSVMSERFVVEPGQFFRSRDEVPVSTARVLLRRLGVLDSPRETQHAAVAAWLDDNQPGPTLVESLELAGFPVHHPV